MNELIKKFFLFIAADETKKGLFIFIGSMFIFVLFIMIIANILNTNKEKEKENVVYEDALCLRSICMQTNSTNECIEFENLSSIVTISKSLSSNNFNLIVNVSKKKCGF